MIIIQALFSTFQLKLVLEEVIKNISKEIQAKNIDYILNVNEEEYVNYFHEKYKVNNINIEENGIYITNIEKMIPAEHFPQLFNVYGGKSYNKTVIQYHIPFVGEEKWLQSRGSTFTSWYPRAEIKSKEIIFEFILFSESYVEEIKREYARNISSLQEQISYINNDINTFNNNFYNNIKQIYLNRKNEILKTNTLLQMFEVPIKKNDNVSETFTIPIVSQRKQIICEPFLNKDSMLKNAPEGRLDDITYHQILKIIDDMGKEFERLPSLYRGTANIMRIYNVKHQS